MAIIDLHYELSLESRFTWLCLHFQVQAEFAEKQRYMEKQLARKATGCIVLLYICTYIATNKVNSLEERTLINKQMHLHTI